LLRPSAAMKHIGSRDGYRNMRRLRKQRQFGPEWACQTTGQYENLRKPTNSP
jgi:hypothetical protein